MKIHTLLMLITAIVIMQPALAMQAPSLDKQLQKEFQQSDINATKVERLLQAGADPSLMINDQTLLEIAVARSIEPEQRPSLKNVIKVLLEHGAIPTQAAFMTLELYKEIEPQASDYFGDIGQMLDQQRYQTFSQPQPQARQPIQLSTPTKSEPFLQKERVSASPAHIPAPTKRAQMIERMNANKNQFQNQPYLTLAVIQPAPGYRSLIKHVESQKTALKGQGYGLVPDKDWHLSVMVFAVPFPNGQIDQGFTKAGLNTLAKIVDDYKKELTDIEFRYRDLATLGTHKYLAANYDFANPQQERNFAKTYDQIVSDFLKFYPNSWMFYGYDIVPHVSVASKMGQKTATATRIPGAPGQPIKNLLFRHAGRGIEISARYYDTNLNKLVELKSNPI